ncbi:MAG: hypothetical protein IPG04_19000 [Polyangiaceae bacterium]|nr:hypothetical protein [Polyangiaceae bacterium]
MALRQVVRFGVARRRSRRGMTVFVVLLVITMLGAVGVFAARSSQLGVSNAGRYREMTQTHYVAEAGMHATVSEFARDANQYLSQLRVTQSPSVVTGDIYPCQDIPFNGVVGFVPASTNCLRLGYGVVEKSARTRSGNAGLQVFVPKSSAVGNVSLPGSFGTANVAGNFAVEITDERTVDPPPAGMPVAGTGPGTSLVYKAVTVRATGQLIPTAADGTLLDPTNDAFKYSTSVEMIRAEVIVGPVAK